MIKNTKFGRCTIERDKDSYFYYNHDLVNEIRKAKGENEVKKHRFNGFENGFDRNHTVALTLGSGKKYIKDGKTYFVEAAYRHWNRGYYVMLLTYTITDDGHFSHSNLYYENINSHDPDTLEYIQENSKIELLDSTIQEKIDIIIKNRNKLNLPTIIHFNEKDARTINTIDIESTPNINELIKEHKKNLKPLFLSGNMEYIEVQHTNFKNTYIHINGLTEESTNDMLYFYRHYEK
jgi:hypothetical protein